MTNEETLREAVRLALEHGLIESEPKQPALFDERVWVARGKTSWLVEKLLAN